MKKSAVVGTHARARWRASLLLMAALCSAGCELAKKIEDKVAVALGRLSVPTGKSLLAVWGSSANDVWLVGSGGTIVHYDGHELALVPSGVTTALQSVQGSGPNDVWFAGEGGVTLHWNGKSVAPSTPARNDTVLGQWVRAPNDAWQVGITTDDELGVLRHWDGKSWHEDVVPGSSSIWKIWGTANELWLVGSDEHNQGFVEHAIGKNADAVPFKGRPLRGVWGSALNDVWVVPYTGPAQHWNGKEWTAASPWVSTAGILNVWGLDRNHVWAVGLNGTVLQFDGATWKRVYVPASENLWAIWGKSANDLWLCGTDGTLLRFDGQHWKRVPVRGAS